MNQKIFWIFENQPQYINPQNLNNVFIITSIFVNRRKKRIPPALQAYYNLFSIITVGMVQYFNVVFSKNNAENNWKILNTILKNMNKLSAKRVFLKNDPTQMQALILASA